MRPSQCSSHLGEMREALDAASARPARTVRSASPRAPAPFAERLLTPRPSTSVRTSPRQLHAHGLPQQTMFAADERSRELLPRYMRDVLPLPDVGKHQFWPAHFGSKAPHAQQQPRCSPRSGVRCRPRPTYRALVCPRKEAMPSGPAAPRTQTPCAAHTAPSSAAAGREREAAALHWTAEELASSVAALGAEFAPIADAFLANGVDGRMVPYLTASTLPSLGVRPFEQVLQLAGHFRQLLHVHEQEDDNDDEGEKHWENVRDAAAIRLQSHARRRIASARAQRIKADHKRREVVEVIQAQLRDHQARMTAEGGTAYLKNLQVSTRFGNLLRQANSHASDPTYIVYDIIEHDSADADFDAHSRVAAHVTEAQALLLISRMRKYYSIASNSESSENTSCRQSVSRITAKAFERRTTVQPIMSASNAIVKGASSIEGEPFSNGRLNSCALELCPTGILRIQGKATSNSTTTRRASLTGQNLGPDKPLEVFPVPLLGVSITESGTQSFGGQSVLTLRVGGSVTHTAIAALFRGCNKHTCGKAGNRWASDVLPPHLASPERWSEDAVLSELLTVQSSRAVAKVPAWPMRAPGSREFSNVSSSPKKRRSSVDTPPDILLPDWNASSASSNLMLSSVVQPIIPPILAVASCERRLTTHAPDGSPRSHTQQSPRNLAAGPRSSRAAANLPQAAIKGDQLPPRMSNVSRLADRADESSHEDWQSGSFVTSYSIDFGAANAMSRSQWHMGLLNHAVRLSRSVADETLTVLHWLGHVAQCRLHKNPHLAPDVKLALCLFRAGLSIAAMEATRYGMLKTRGSGDEARREGAVESVAASRSSLRNKSFPNVRRSATSTLTETLMELGDTESECSHQTAITQAAAAESLRITSLPSEAVRAALFVTLGSRLQLLAQDGRDAPRLCFARVAASASALICDGLSRGTLLGALPGLSTRGNASTALAARETQEDSHGCGFRLILKSYELDVIAASPWEMLYWVRGVNWLPVGFKSCYLFELVQKHHPGIATAQGR